MEASDLDPKALARAMAIETAEDPSQVGDYVGELPAGDHVVDYRFQAHIIGYEGWQWSVTLFHDEQAQRWTVDESTLVPTDDALLPPAWVPWKDRLEPSDLSVTDSIGTDPDDPRLEEGLVASSVVEEAGQDGAGREAQAVEEKAEVVPTATGSDIILERAEADVEEGPAGASVQESGDVQVQATADSPEDIQEAVQAFDLSRRHVLSPLGRSQTAKRWYEGPHGPKSLSTKTADGNVCSTCGFFIPIQGELDRMFGVCANRWSPDDGRVVSLDHGCGEHSEIDPPEPSRLWVQTKPAFDDMHIDIVAQRNRDERGDVELMEQVEDADGTVEETTQASITVDNAVESADPQEASPSVESTLDVNAR